MVIGFSSLVLKTACVTGENFLPARDKCAREVRPDVSGHLPAGRGSRVRSVNSRLNSGSRTLGFCLPVEPTSDALSSCFGSFLILSLPPPSL